MENRRLWSRTRTTLALALTLPLVGALHAAEAQEGVLEVSEIGLRMSMPADWQEGGVSGDSVLASYTGGSGLHPGLNVTREDPGDRTLEQVRDYWLGLLPDVTVHGQEDRSISGRNALFVDASWVSIMGGLRAVRLFVEYGDQVIVITFVTGDADDGAAVAEYSAYLESASFE